jgi:hypothetical protein
MTVDTTWTPNPSNTIWDVAIDGTTVYALGTHNTIGSNGLTIPHLAAISANGSGGAIPTWNPKLNGVQSSSYGYQLAMTSTKVMAAGNFLSFGDTTRNRAAAIDLASMTVLPWNPNVTGAVRAIALDGTSVFLGGEFTSVGGSTRARFAVVNNSTGALDLSVASVTVGSTVRWMIPTGSAVYLGGNFTGITSAVTAATRNRIGALDRTTWGANTWDPNANGVVWTGKMVGTSLLVGGEFTTIGGSARNRLAALDITTSTATSWDPNAGSTVFTIATNSDGSTVYVGGTFSGAGSIGGGSRNRLAAFNSAAGTLSSYSTTTNIAGNTVTAVAANTGYVYAVGSFTGGAGQFYQVYDAISGNTIPSLIPSMNVSGAGPTTMILDSNGNVILGFAGTAGGLTQLNSYRLRGQAMLGCSLNGN